MSRVWQTKIWLKWYKNQWFRGSFVTKLRRKWEKMQKWKRTRKRSKNGVFRVRKEFCHKRTSNSLNSLKFNLQIFEFLSVTSVTCGHVNLWICYDLVHFLSVTCVIIFSCMILARTDNMHVSHWIHHDFGTVRIVSNAGISGFALPVCAHICLFLSFWDIPLTMVHTVVVSEWRNKQLSE